ncbi:MAG: class I SAM-dependent methyltransferase, partial [Lachnospiraceae bacterium]|nr:class I SAM-dependent methyltransferase [Lachnospiraceae bacterium]
MKVRELSNDLIDTRAVGTQMGIDLEEERMDDFPIYDAFAEVYDEFMDDVPYEQWCDRIDQLLKQFAPKVADTQELESERRLVVDLGCGTGTLSMLLAQKGYDMIGVDQSPQMLQLAMQKAMSVYESTLAEEGMDATASHISGSAPLFLLQDMRELDLYSTVGAVISVCDSFNYLLTREDLLTVFSRVNNFLYPGGLFLFDFNTPFKYETILGDVTIAENRDTCSFIWENEYDPETGINEYDLTLFIEEADGRYRRFTERHYQRGYTPQEIQA